MTKQLTKKQKSTMFYDINNTTSKEKLKGIITRLKEQVKNKNPLLVKNTKIDDDTIKEQVFNQKFKNGSISYYAMTTEKNLKLRNIGNARWKEYEGVNETQLYHYLIKLVENKNPRDTVLINIDTNVGQRSLIKPVPIQDLKRMLTNKNKFLNFLTEGSHDMMRMYNDIGIITGYTIAIIHRD